MGGNYGKGMYHQLMDVMARLDGMENECQKDRKEISSLAAEIKSLRKENTQLRTVTYRIRIKQKIQFDYSKMLGGMI